MKYMGSKRAMLQNGLGQLLLREAASALRFFDLFSGSGAVAVHVATNISVPVYAYDLQEYSSILSGAVVTRCSSISHEAIWSNWHRRATAHFDCRYVPDNARITKSIVADLRAWSSEQEILPITKAYGGHYFSPRQSVWIDCLRRTLPRSHPARTVALAALIQAASQCAAAPGHTAQPFQPTRTARPFLKEAWAKDMVGRTRSIFFSLAGRFAKQPGHASVGDANVIAQQLREGDLAFIDPAYSGVHYSRFYHVLETIARGDSGIVTGTGRYPEPALRPRSDYSIGSQSAIALDDLLSCIAGSRSRAILTFPDYYCSNGLSGDSVRNIARKYFRLRERHVDSKFSTLGGTGGCGRNEGNRIARHNAKELMLVLQPK